MKKIKCLVATKCEELDDAARIRYEVLAKEQRLFDPVRHAIPREVDALDTLPTTKHFLAYVDEAPVGTGRMILPNAEVALATKTIFGFDIESKFVLENLVRPGMRIAETMRYCVLPAARNLPVAAALVQEGLRFSHEFGITHWLGSATMETSDPANAARIAAVAAEKGFVDHDALILPRQTISPKGPTDEAAFGSSSCGLPTAPPSNTDVPRVLFMYLRRLKARIIGPPTYDTRFRGYSIPILIAVADQKHWTDELTRSPQPSPIAA